MATETPESVEAQLQKLQAALEADGQGFGTLASELIHDLGDSKDHVPFLKAVPLDAMASFLERCSSVQPAVERTTIHEWLDLLRESDWLRRLPQDQHQAWAERYLKLIECSRFNLGLMFQQRAKRYGSKILFEPPLSIGRRGLSWRQTASKVDWLARGLLALEQHHDAPGPVAILSENRLEGALIDLACLCAGVRNVMIPANATHKDVRYMLEHSGVTTLFISSHEQYAKVQRHRSTLPQLKFIFSLDSNLKGMARVQALDQLLTYANRVTQETLEQRIAEVPLDGVTTVMYTSGTTGVPKGICFSQRNLVFKRFARGIALPEIGDKDVFVSYLPLFHTFGRYLEMLGCVYWGAKYCFVQDPSIDSLVRTMRRHRPTVFISIPKKWIELYEAAIGTLDSTYDDLSEAEKEVRSLTGGRLRWGLSAAGHLDADIFKFFQDVGVELMSGFGMTEATGGITMTPPGEYRDDSLGIPLPGIETRIAEDGELCIRGAYVMEGYLDPPDGNVGFDEEGWFATGDLMEEDSKGHITLVDRKKEIYKNIRGETVAPQRIENLFRDFDSIERVFLVGDHRPYNTLLIYPKPNYEPLSLDPESPETQEHFRSIVSSVNQFLSPFERIVDFALMPRDLDAEQGELTAKNTPRRKTVERHFQELIQPLYKRNTFLVGGAEVEFPNWLLQALGVTTRDLRVKGDQLHLPGRTTSLEIRQRGRGVTQVGACVYRHRPGVFKLGGLVSSARLWLGNEHLTQFLQVDLTPYQRKSRDSEGIRWRSRRRPLMVDDRLLRQFSTARDQNDPGLQDLHLAALLIASDDEAHGIMAIDWFARLLRINNPPLAEPIRVLLRRTASSGTLKVRRKAFEVLVVHERRGRFKDTARHFLASPGRLLDSTTRHAIAAKNLSTDRLDSLFEIAIERLSDPSSTKAAQTQTQDFLKLLSEYGSRHPTSYRKVRAFLEHAQTRTHHEPLAQAAEFSANSLTKGFRVWLGTNAMLAVDSEDGTEYTWEDVLAFDNDVPLVDRRRLIQAMSETGMLREAVFLFSSGALVRLSDIPVGGVWIQLLAARHGKSVYRVTVQTRFLGAFDFVVNLNQSLPADYVREEIHWLIVCGSTPSRPRLVEDFGGYWPDHDLWTEEYIPGESLEVAMRRLSKRSDDGERLKQTWPFFAWTTLAACIDFWDRTERRFELTDASLPNVIAPTHDYHLGARLVSLTGRRPHVQAAKMLRSLWEGLVYPVEATYPELKGVVDETTAFSAWVEVLGEQEGLRTLREWHEDPPEAFTEPFIHKLKEFLSSVDRRGFLPLRLYFAAKRFRRWDALASEATLQAKAETLTDLYETYRLDSLNAQYPAARVRFFLETVFKNANAELVKGLEAFVEDLRTGARVPDEMIEGIADLRAQIEVTPEEDYFLTRLGFPHLKPKDDATFEHVRTGGRSAAEVVVQHEDTEGNRFRIRHALTPKEVGKLHQLFIDANLDVRFLPEHRFLVALNERNQLIGGIFYDLEDEGETAHLEKIVVAGRFRKLGVADELMNEWIHRIKALNIARVTTGFFRPEFFYRHGFRIGKKSAGLIRELDTEEESTPGSAAP